jgi:cobalt-precorrin 5A hydrolase/precorrin-3B C17-methyltransferase
LAKEPVVICLSKSGERTAQNIAQALSCSVHGREGRVSRADAYFPNALEHVRTLFAAGVPIIGVCAAGILVRAVAPLLSDKTIEPPVIAVPDDGSVVIPLLGGHRGANRLATRIASVLGVSAAITTAGDVSIGAALDEPPKGYRLANPQDAKSAMAGILAGEGVQVVGEDLFDLTTNAAGQIRIITGEAPVDTDEKTLAFHPQNYVLGLGCARGCSPDEVWELTQQALAKANIAAECLAAVASLDLKGDEPAMIETAKRLGVPFRVFTAGELEAQAGRLQTPSDIVFAEVGCHGVAEGAALALAGESAALAVAKLKSANATASLARTENPITELSGRSRGKLSIIGIGPGQHSWRTPEASSLVAEAEELVGYGLYIDLLGALAFGKTRSDFPLGGEEDRCRYALEQAGLGKNVALICSGDAGIYAMGALVFELLDRGSTEHGVSDAARRIEVVSTPGVSALQGAAARAGAPLGHDFCAISLSDLLTPRQDIIRRLNAAAEGDFVIAFYNPVSKRRRTLLDEARNILLKHRPDDTPVMLASSLGRPEEHIRYRTLKDLKTDEVDMLTVVLVGSSHSRLAELGEGPRMFTPRGYARKIDGDLAQAAKPAA